MKKLIVKYKLELIGGVVGLILGWSYWYFIGCASGTCAITSSPINSSLYGSLLGGLLFSMFKKNNANKEQKIKE
ncbi:MAG: DUF6132 family protein [Bacteroidota bacterium]|nr:DUF6132 family protein [Bacteroidota bacterium]